jgi:hypothetical protein
MFLTFIWGSQAFRPSVAPDAAMKVIFVLLAVASLGGMVWGALKSVLIADSAGVLVRDPFSLRRLSWNERGSWIGRYKLFEATCLIDLKVGSSTYAFAIQVPRLSRTRSGTQESRMVADLNVRLPQPAPAHPTTEATE